ncbi:MAG: hypothetical protein LBL59_04905 [Xanthomonadaceae bacterium]|jgi:hypothetical protein|nr:hypothetical protein [Xanthomonadaceae bacterium]
MSTPPSAVRARQTAITPYQKRWTETLRYPLREKALTNAIAMALFSLLSHLPAIGLLMSALFWFAVWKYVFECLNRTAHGHLQPPERALNVGNGAVWHFLGLQLVFSIVWVLLLVFGHPRLAFALVAPAVLLLPAVAMSLAMDGNLRFALRPATWLGIVRRLGGAYLMLWLMLIALCALTVLNSMASFAWGYYYLPVDIVFKVVLIGTLIMIFHLMGYLIYQNHAAFKLSPTAPADTLVRAGDHEASLRQRAGQLHEQGDPAAAAELLRQYLSAHSASIDFHADYLQCLRATGDREALLKHAPVYLGLLAMDNQERRGLSLLRECLDMEPGFTLADPELTMPYANRAIGLGQTRLALALLMNSIRAWPRHILAPEWATLAAEHMPHRGDAPQYADIGPTLQEMLRYCDDLETRRSLEKRFQKLGYRV